jgi:hypothetical protein
MKTRDKLLKTMIRAGLSTFQQSCALMIYDARGIHVAAQYVNLITIENVIGGIE